MTEKCKARELANSYRRTDNMNFGLAIEAMKKGKKVARKGWNGKGMFIYLVEGSNVGAEMIQGRARLVTESLPNNDCIDICPHIDMKSADDKIVIGWLASQADMLSDDWVIVE